MIKLRQRKLKKYLLSVIEYIDDKYKPTYLGYINYLSKKHKDYLYILRKEYENTNREDVRELYSDCMSFIYFNYEYRV